MKAKTTKKPAKKVVVKDLEAKKAEAKGGSGLSPKAVKKPQSFTAADDLWQ